MNDIEYPDDNDVITIEHENLPRPSTSGSSNERDNVERQETAPAHADSTSSSPTVTCDVIATMAARVASLETRLIAMDNIQALLRSKSAQLVECSGRLRESESARRKAERLLEIVIRPPPVNRSPDGMHAPRSADFVRFQIPSTHEPADVCSDSSGSDEGSVAKNNDDFGRSADVCDDCGLWTPVRKSMTTVGGSVDETPGVPTVEVSAAGDAAAAMRDRPYRDRMLSVGAVGGKLQPSMDLIVKLMRQNARLKETIKQMIERQHQMTVAEYLDWLEQDDVRQQRLNQQVRWRHAAKPKLLVNSHNDLSSRDNDTVNVDSGRETSGNSISQPQ